MSSFLSFRCQFVDPSCLPFVVSSYSNLHWLCHNLHNVLLWMVLIYINLKKIYAGMVARRQEEAWSWWQLDVSPQQALEVLTGKSDGAFVIRLSEKNPST